MSLEANVGFVRNVGFEDANGQWQLASDHTALWGALQVSPGLSIPSLQTYIFSP